MLEQLISSSFFLSEEEKLSLLWNLSQKSERYKTQLENILQNEKYFILSLLKKYKEDSQLHSISEMKGYLISQNLKRIKQLEEQEEQSTVEELFNNW